MYTILEQREIFHLVFLRQLAKRLKPNIYAIKGGCNLRFFYQSPRYSEDMDIDIKKIEVFRLKNLVMEILTSKTLVTTLRPFQIDDIIPPDVKTAKQTETVQRFKVHLLTANNGDLFTKIEFSRRVTKEKGVADAVDHSMLYAYKQSSLILFHYPAPVAIVQKIQALADRKNPQARDIFDIFILYSRVGREDIEHIRKKLPQDLLVKAQDTLFSIDYKIFSETVCNYLNDEDKLYYGQKAIWEDVQLKVSEIISTR